MTDKPPIPGFARQGHRYRAPVSLSREDAEDVAAEAAERGVPVSIVLLERVRAGRRAKPCPHRRHSPGHHPDQPSVCDECGAEL